MSQIFQEDKVIPVTVVEAGPVIITQIRSTEKDRYEAVQIGFDPTKKKLSKPVAGHLNKIKSLKPEIQNVNFRYLKEFRVDSVDKYKIGDEINVSVFKEGDKVKISALSKGKGFQGVVKRHGFGGGPKTHGQKNRLRAPGSIGSTAFQRVVLGRRMAGQMGQKRVTVKNLEIVKVDAEKNLLMIKGAIPGRRGTLVEIIKES